MSHQHGGAYTTVHTSGDTTPKKHQSPMQHASQAPSGIGNQHSPQHSLPPSHYSHQSGSCNHSCSSCTSPPHHAASTMTTVSGHHHHHPPRSRTSSSERKQDSHHYQIMQPIGDAELQHCNSFTYLHFEEVIALNEEVLGVDTADVINRGSLESAIEDPQETFANHEIHKCIEEKIYALALPLAQNHPFEDGNKRTATEAVLLFLKKNHVELAAPEEQLPQISELVNRLVDLQPISKGHFVQELKGILNHFFPSQSSVSSSDHIKENKKDDHHDQKRQIVVYRYLSHLHQHPPQKQSEFEHAPLSTTTTGTSRSTPSRAVEKKQKLAGEEGEEEEKRELSKEDEQFVDELFSL